MIRIAAQEIYKQTLINATDDVRLSSHSARQQTRRALASYIAGAVMMPYDSYLEDAKTHRYDIELLSQKYNTGFEQACHRLINLRKPGAEGIPLAFMRVDAAGYISKRFPLARLWLPRYGHLCPLWTVFSALQTPGKITHHLAEFPDGNRFMMVARTVEKPAASFHGSPIRYAIMLACDIIDADRMVYTEGMDLTSNQASRKVGPTCHQCSRYDCQQRQEQPLTLTNPGDTKAFYGSLT